MGGSDGRNEAAVAAQSGNKRGMRRDLDATRVFGSLGDICTTDKYQKARLLRNCHQKQVSSLTTDTTEQVSVISQSPRF